MTKKIISIIFVSIAICFAAACSNEVPTDNNGEPVETYNGLPVSEMVPSYIVDVNDPVKLVSSADYVFVGNVVENKGCEYTEDERVYTNYTIQVIQNIKGELRTDRAVPIIKWGGLYIR